MEEKNELADPSGLISGKAASWLRVYTLGTFHIEWVDPQTGQGQPLPQERLHKRGAAPSLALLKALLCRPDRFATRDWLLEQFWPDSSARSASDRLDDVASALRGLLRPEGCQDKILHFVYGADGRGNGYRLDGYPQLWCDADALLWSIQQAARMERFGDDPFPFWQRAYDLASRGTYLPEQCYDDWSEARREETRGHLRQAVYALARLYVERFGRAGEEEALLVLRTYWLDHPTDEDALRQLMELLGKRERFQEAGEYYERLRKLLEEEGQQPTTQTQDLAEYLHTKQMQRTPQSENPLYKQFAPTLASHDTSVHAASDHTILLNNINGIQDVKDQHLDSQRRKMLQHIVEIAGATFLTPLDLLQDLSENRGEKSQEGVLYEHLLALSWDHYYTTSAQQAVHYVDQWLTSLALAVKRTPGKEQARLMTLLCHFYQLSGVAARDRMDFAQALLYGKRAIELAFHLEDAELIVAALFRRAKTLLKSQQLIPAIQDIEAALSYTRRVRDPLKGYVHQATAAAYALLAEQDREYQTKSLRLFDTATHIIEDGNLDDDHSFVKLNNAGLSIDRAKALVIFQNLDEARRTLEVARQQLGPNLPRWQARLLTVDAEISLAENDPQQSCALAHQVLRIVQITQSLSSKQGILSFHAKLQEHFPTHPAVLQLTEALIDHRRS